MNKSKFIKANIVILIIVIITILGITLLKLNNDLSKTMHKKAEAMEEDGISVEKIEMQNEEISYLIKFVENNGIKEIRYPDGFTIYPNNKVSVAIDYKVVEGGKYQFTVIDGTGTTKIREIKVPRDPRLDYAIITENGIVNCIDDDENYYLDKNVNPKANDSLGVMAYDGLDSTYADCSGNDESYVKYIKIDSSAIGLDIFVLWSDGSSFSDTYMCVTDMEGNKLYTKQQGNLAKTEDKYTIVSEGWLKFYPNNNMTSHICMYEITINSNIEYPVITENGVMNWLNKDGSYVYRDDVKSNAFGKKAYDKNEETFQNYDIGLGNKRFINVDSSAIGKKLYFKCNLYAGGIFFENSDGQYIATTISTNKGCSGPNSINQYFWYHNNITDIWLIIPEGTTRMGIEDGSSYSHPMRFYEIWVDD